MIWLRNEDSFEKCPEYPEFMKSGRAEYYTKLGPNYYKIQYFVPRPVREPKATQRYVPWPTPNWKVGDPPAILIFVGMKHSWWREQTLDSWTWGGWIQHRFRWDLKWEDRDANSSKLHKILFKGGLQDLLMEELL